MVLSLTFGAIAVFSSATSAPQAMNGLGVFTASKPYRSAAVDGTISVAVPAGWAVQWLGRNGGYLTSRDGDAVLLGEFYPVPSGHGDPLERKGYLSVPYVADPASALARLHDRYYLCRRCEPVSIASETLLPEPATIAPYLRNLGPTDNALVRGDFVSDDVPRRFKAVVAKTRLLRNGRWILGMLSWESSKSERFDKALPEMDAIVSSVDRPRK